MKKELQKVTLYDRRRESDFRRIIQAELDAQGKEVEDLRHDFRRDFEYYNFRDFMNKKKDVCSLNFFEKVMKILNREVCIQITIKDRR
ncbi:hypothetical protein [Romboutsia ilealis]|uniref:hypothetical protein n=1 Tax=Romboutsia ilealis TaxID=1115758 RepID=UPI00272B6D7B|nr:hypothetical protein [Romboutsia ilealis]